jgi:hypothetical protein
MPEPSNYDNQKDWMAACVPARIDEGNEQEQAVAACLNIWREHTGEGKAMDNALKAVRQTDDELVVANYIVVYGGRDLEGIASPNVNADGSKGEYFTPATDLESRYTKAGALYVDWEHCEGEAGDDILGVVDWKTARRDEQGVFVERVLNRRNQYVKWLEGLIDEGLIGTSSQADPQGVQKADDGAILRWPLERDTLTVAPMEPRMMTENHLQAFKALGIDLPARDDTAGEPEPPEAEPEAVANLDSLAAASAAGQGRMRLQLLRNQLTMEG